jgi:hexokinase
MLYSIPQLQEFASNLIVQIKSSENGKKTDLAFAVNDLPKIDSVEDGQVFQVMMMGGSHLESALMKYTKGKAEILSFYEDELPTLVSKEVVMEVFAKNYDPNVKFIALNFAYPLKSVTRDGILDGILLHGTKEHTFKNLVGQTVGEEIEKYIAFTKNKQVKVSVCNDTVALGLASLGFKKEYNQGNTIFGVVGTGFNFGSFKNDQELVNLESGNFSHFEQSYTGKILDALSPNYSQQKLEKEVGGAYLVRHFNILANLEGFHTNLKNTKEMSELAESNQERLPGLAIEVFQRAASLVAMHIYALYLWKQEKAEAKKDYSLLVLIEGSLFLKGYHFRQFVDEYLSALGLKKENYHIDHFKNIGIYGAAKLAKKQD